MTTQQTAQHTPGAIRAAEAITGGEYGDDKQYATAYGRKTVVGIADIIDRETAAPELLAVLSTILDVWDERKIIGPMTYADARAAIAKARGEA